MYYRDEPVQYMSANDAAIAWTLQKDEITRRAPARQSSWPTPAQRLAPSVQPRSEAESTAVARQRIVHRLSQYSLVEKQIKGDGACQFRAIADQLFGSEAEHARVRSNICYQLYRHPELYQQHVPGNYASYCQQMLRLTTWGDHVTLQAAADAYGVRILVLTSWRDSEVVEVVPRDVRSQQIVYLSFWGGSHYNSVYQRGAASRRVLGSKRLHRLLFS